MTKCSAFPRAFGTFPAGSAVLVKSRFALYSASGAEARAPRVERVPAAARVSRLEVADLAAEPLLEEALAEPALVAVDLVERLAAERAAQVRLAAQQIEMARRSEPVAAAHREVPTKPAPRVAQPALPARAAAVEPALPTTNRRHPPHSL